MSANTYKIRSVGGALIVTIPQHILKLVPLQAGDMVTFDVLKKVAGPVIAVEPVRKKTRDR